MPELAILLLLALFVLVFSLIIESRNTPKG